MVYRHSSAHLLAAAVLELFPETKLGHGPATETGFFYDFYRPTPFTPEDLEKIEKKMQELVQQDIPYAREFLPRTEGLEKFKAEGDFMKCHFIEQFTKPDEKISIYKTGKFLDFCRGPHIPSTGQNQSVQAAEYCRRVLAGRREEPAAAAHLRHVVLLEERPRCLSAQHRGSEEARPSRDRSAARSVLHPGTRRAGPDLLASQGRHHPQRDGRLDARPSTSSAATRWCTRRTWRAGSCGRPRATKAITRRTCSTPWSSTMRNTA